MPHSRRRDSSSDSSDFGAPVVKIRTEQVRSRRDVSPGIVNTQQFLLGVPDQRRERASSMGANDRINIISLGDRDISPNYSSRHHRGSTSRERELQRQLDLLQLERHQESQRDRILRDERDRITREKEQREQWIREAETRKREDEDKRKRLIIEAQVEEEAKKIRDRAARDKAVEEWKLEQFRKEEEKKRKEKEAQLTFEREFRKRMAARGYSDASIDSFLKKTKDGESSRREDRRPGSGTELALVDLSGDRPTWIKVARKHLHPETLEHFNLPWKYDEVRCSFTHLHLPSKMYKANISSRTTTPTS